MCNISDFYLYCNVMGMTDELYRLACKLFESDVRKLMDTMWGGL